MSIDRSLKVNSGLLGKRSVLTRAERIEKLRHDRRWLEGDSVLGLPKVRTVFKSKAKKKKKDKDEEEGTEAVGGEATPAT